MGGGKETERGRERVCVTGGGPVLFRPVTAFYIPGTAVGNNSGRAAGGAIDPLGRLCAATKIDTAILGWG